jgi:type 1 glutamine amidotransferase
MRSLFLALLLSVTSFYPAMAHETYRVLVFSKTRGFRHDSIPAGITAIKKLAVEKDFAVDTTEDATLFTDSNLARYKVLIFLNTTGDVLDDAQQAAMERFIRSGNGYVGVHSASDTEFSWPWYGKLVGAYFDSHPAIQTATIRIENRSHPSTKSLPDPWSRRDEWYNFRTNPRSRVNVLARVDESSYTGGKQGADHPIAWYQIYDGGRSWYTALGHTKESYQEPDFLTHLAGGIEWAADLQINDDLSYELKLSEGWNLISFPLELENRSVETVFKPLDNFLVYAYDGTSYQSYNPDSIENSLQMIEAGRGYWVHMQSSVTLKVSGKPAIGNISLKQGWNLAGFNSLKSIDVASALSSLGSRFEAIYGYEQRFKGYFQDQSGDLKILEPGRGYWIYVTSDLDWTLPDFTSS